METWPASPNAFRKFVDPWRKKYQLDELLPLAAQGCLGSLKFMQKWKVQTICDRSYAAWFSRGRSESKVMTWQTSGSARGKTFAPNKCFEEYFYNVDEKTGYILHPRYKSTLRRVSLVVKHFPRAFRDVCPVITFDSDRPRENQAA